MTDREVGNRDNEDLTLLPEVYFQWLEEVNNNSTEITLLEDNLFKTASINAITTGIITSTLLNSICSHTTETELTSKGLKKGKDYESWDGLFLHQKQIFVPDKEDLRGWVIQDHHDLPHHRHPGQKKTEELIARSYWWPHSTIMWRNTSQDVRTAIRPKLITSQLMPLYTHSMPQKVVGRRFLLISLVDFLTVGTMMPS